MSDYIKSVTLTESLMANAVTHNTYIHTYIHTLLTFPLEAFQRQYNNNLKLLKNSKIIFRLKIN